MNRQEFEKLYLGKEVVITLFDDDRVLKGKLEHDRDGDRIYPQAYILDTDPYFVFKKSHIKTIMTKGYLLK